MGEANRGSAQSHGWARKVYVIAVVICVRKMLIAKEARYAVSMVAKMTVSTLVYLPARRDMKNHFSSLPWVDLFQAARKMVDMMRCSATHPLAIVGV